MTVEVGTSFKVSEADFGHEAYFGASGAGWFAMSLFNDPEGGHGVGFGGGGDELLTGGAWAVNSLTIGGEEVFFSMNRG